MINNKLTNTELEIMQYIWSMNCEVTARDVRLHFSHKMWSKQAVSTFLKQLVKSGYLSIRKESVTKYYYSAAITKAEYNISPAKDIMDQFFSGSLRNFFCALIKPIELSAEQIQDLDNLISQISTSDNSSINKSDT